MPDEKLGKLSGTECEFGITLSECAKSKLNIENRYEIMERVPNELEVHQDRIKSANLIWYTDGSKTKDSVSTGFYSTEHSSIVNLGKLMTVYEAEVLGIIKVGEYLIENKTKNKNILICTDSEATVKSLRKDLSKSYLLQNCSNVLNDLAKDNKVTINCFPEHKGVEGNEETNKLAKPGAFSLMIRQ